MKTLLSVLEIYFNVYAITACFFSYPEAMNIEIEGEPDPEVRSVSSKNEFGFLNYLHFYTHHMKNIITSLVLFYFTSICLNAQKSLAPQYTFPSTLEKQEEALKTNPLVLRFAESREQLLADPHRPVYHFVSPEGNLNDPNGLCFWQGNWHLFYQAYPVEDPRQHWGHAISKDLIHWRDLPLAIYPDPEDRCFSGSALVEDNRVIANYFGVGLGNMVAVSDDPLLLNWEKIGDGAVIPMSMINREHGPHHIYDPFIWEEGGMYYSISGLKQRNTQTGKFFPTGELFQSPDLKQWKYVHQMIEGDYFTVAGTDAACPYFWPIGERYIYLFFSHYRGFGGAQYWLGDYDSERKIFTPTSHGYFNHGAVRPGGVHAPSATTDGKGGVITIFNINEGKRTEGWNRIMSLPLRLTMKEPGDNIKPLDPETAARRQQGLLLERDQLNIEPAGDIESLRYNHQFVDKMILPANEEIVFEHISGNAMEIIVEIDPKGAPYVELNVLRSPGREEYTRIIFYKNRDLWDANSTLTICTDYSSILPEVNTRPAEKAPLHLYEGENLKLRVFIDKSVVEIFANGKQYAAVRVYPGLEESTGVSLRSHGRESELISLDAWQMKNIWDTSLKEWYEKTVWQP